MAAPATPTNLSVLGPVKLGSTFKVTLSCDDAETITYTLRETSGGAALFTVTSSQRVSPGFGSWYYWLPSDQLVNGTGYVEAYATNSDGTSGTAGKSFTVHIPPTVTVTAPQDGSTVSSLPLTVGWTATSADGITSPISVAIADAGGSTVYSTTTSAQYASITITSDEIVLTDGVQYTVTVGARSGKGMDGYGESDFTVSWPKPAKPTVTAVQNGLSVTATVHKGTGGAATDHLMLMRYDASKDEWTTIADNLADGGQATDALPPLGVPVTYRAVAVSSIGASTASDDLALTVVTASWAFNFKEDGALSTIQLGYNPQASYTMGHGGESYHFADGGEGGGLPVWYGTTDRDESGTLKFDTVMNADADALRAAVMAHPVMWLRDPFGHRWRAHVTLSYTHGVGQLWPVTLTWNAVRFEEA